MELIDLSVPINEQLPVYPGDPKTKIISAGELDRDGFTDHYVSFGTHAGTHIDAPLHMIKNGKSLDNFRVEHFVSRGCLVKSFDLKEIKQNDIRAGDIVLFKTGMSEQYYDPEYFQHYPAMDVEVAQYLVSKKIKMVGIDTCSVDNMDGFPVHKILLKEDILIIENLTNLSELLNKPFKVYALPINLQVDAAPARVIAEVLN